MTQRMHEDRVPSLAQPLLGLSTPSRGPSNQTARMHAFAQQHFLVGANWTCSCGATACLTSASGAHVELTQHICLHGMWPVFSERSDCVVLKGDMHSLDLDLQCLEVCRIIGHSNSE